MSVAGQDTGDTPQRHIEKAKSAAGTTWASAADYFCAESSMPMLRMAERRFRTMRRPRVTSTEASTGGVMAA